MEIPRCIPLKSDRLPQIWGPSDVCACPAPGRARRECNDWVRVSDVFLRLEGTGSGWVTRPVSCQEGRWATALNQPCLIKQGQVGNQPRSDSPASWYGVVSGTPQGAPNGLLSSEGSVAPGEADALRKDWQTLGGFCQVPGPPQRMDRRNSLVGNANEGLGKSGPRRRETVILWVFSPKNHHHHSPENLQAWLLVVLDQPWLGHENPDNSLPSWNPIFLIYVIIDPKPGMDEIIGFKCFLFSQGILYSNGALQRINKNIYEI